MNNSSKTLKWTSKRVQTTRIQKCQSNKPIRSLYKMAQKKTNKNPTMIPSVADNIKALQDELEFTCDSLATINILYESLYQAYKLSEPELEKTKSATRLCEKEKELLTEYDDLGLQISHFSSKFTELENRIAALKESEEEVYDIPSSLASPCSSIETSMSEMTPRSDYIQSDYIPSDFLLDTNCYIPCNDYPTSYYQPHSYTSYCDQIYPMYPLI